MIKNEFNQYSTFLTHNKYLKNIYLLHNRKGLFKYDANLHQAI
jgi:hypothetical protein